MRTEENSLDLNNLPEDLSRDGDFAFDQGGSSSSGIRRNGKEYECRFCSLKFCKSQALGGHMNRHRQERETEALDQARQLVLRNDNFASPLATRFGYHPGDPALHRTLMCTQRAISNSSSTFLSPPPPPPPPPLPPQPYLYPPRVPYAMLNDNYFDHTFHQPISYTCLGSPVGPATVSRDDMMSGQVPGLGRQHGPQQPPLGHAPLPSPPRHSSVNRIQDFGF